MIGLSNDRGWQRLTSGAHIVLAPMAGVTDVAFRTICRRAVPLVTVTEMVSSKGLVYADAKTARLTRIQEDEHPSGVQIFGSEPDTMGRAAVLALAQSGADYVDINMGCPTPKIVRNGDGCALMQQPDLAGRIIEAVCAAVTCPVTVKFRRGWDKGSLNYTAFATMCQQAGAAAIAIHGRTRAQLYSGRADWDCIAEVKAAVTIPVIANGDIDSEETALRVLRHTKADKLMIGRAAFGNPFLLARIHAAIEGTAPPSLPTVSVRAVWARDQFLLTVADKGERVAVLESRRFINWYLHGLPHRHSLRQEIISLATQAEVLRLLSRLEQESPYTY